MSMTEAFTRGDKRGSPKATWWAVSRGKHQGWHPSPKDRRYTPFMGMVTIIMNDYPQVKTAVLALLAVLVITNRE